MTNNAKKAKFTAEYIICKCPQFGTLETSSSNKSRPDTPQPKQVEPKKIVNSKK